MHTSSVIISVITISALKKIISALAFFQSLPDYRVGVKLMRKSIITIFFILFFGIFSHAAHAGTTPDRIISLAPNITEILFALELGDHIVGVTNFCDYPEEARNKPKIGGMSNPSLEAVVSQHPDIVVMTTDGNQKEFEKKLRTLKIKTYVFKARRIAELPQGIRDLGQALGVKERANLLAREIEAAMHAFKVKDSTAQHSGTLRIPLSKGRFEERNNKVLFIIWPEPLIAAGPGTAIDDIITLLQGNNIASRARVAYPKYSIEEIIRQAPDYIFIGKGHENVKEISQGLLKKVALVPAVKNGSVCFVSDTLYRLSPRIVNGIEEMARCIRSKSQQ
jgi:iron complex transport system substrate-binding protein